MSDFEELADIIFVCKNCEMVFEGEEPEWCENCHEAEFSRYVKEEFQ